MNGDRYNELDIALVLCCIQSGYEPILPAVNADGRRPVSDGELMFRTLTARAGMLAARGVQESIEVN